MAHEEYYFLYKIKNKVMSQKMNCQIVNMVATTTTNEKLNLNKIQESYSNAKYNPQVYFALIYKITDPKVSILVNWSGKLIITGAKSEKEIEISRNIFFNDMKKIGYCPQINDIIIQNIVLNLNFGKTLNLEKIYESNRVLDIDYDPELFPGLIFKNDNPRFTALFFKSGKIVMTGVKDLKRVPECQNSIQLLLKNNQ